MVQVGRPVIALTGATGFLGSHIMAAMIENGLQVGDFGPAEQDPKRYANGSSDSWDGSAWMKSRQPGDGGCRFLKAMIGISAEEIR